ncbi:TPA: tail fiber protein, partial [Kluyvera intermedia]|nr:tail fiber protein [Kluyvera intermedia]
MEVYMGTILPFAFNYPPYGFALCYGQQYSVGQYQALYSLLGIFYGGNGTTTFNLPNLSGRMLIGSGPAQTDINMPAHNVG